MKYKEVLPLKPTVTVSIVYFNELQMLCTLSSNGDIFRSALSACSCCWYHVDTDHSSNYSWMNHSTVTCYSFFFFLYPGNACAILKRLSEFSCRRVCPETEPVQLLPFQLCFSSLWRLCLKAPSGPGDAWCHCWGCWREHPPPTLGTTAAGKKKKLDSVTLKRIYSVVFFYFELKPNAEYFPDTLFWGRCDHTKEFCFEFVEEK